MKIHVYIIAWNEEKILPFTLDHYSQFAKKIFVFDNMSTDSSDDIYKKYPKVEVKKWQTPEKKYNDVFLADLKSNIYKKSRKDNVDWVIVCDCDELLYHENLLEKLEEYKKNGITMPKIDGHDMCSEIFPEYDGELITNKIKTGSHTYEPMCKNIIFNPILEVRYMPGAHNNLTPNAIFSETAELKLLHYKFLGKEYTSKRYQNLSEQLSDFNLQSGFSSHWTKSPLEYLNNILSENFKVI
jgi:hypothetical protein